MEDIRKTLKETEMMEQMDEVKIDRQDQLERFGLLGLDKSPDVDGLYVVVNRWAATNS